MDKHHIRVLHIEDNPGDARLVKEMLAEESQDDSRLAIFDLVQVARLEDAVARLAADSFDIVIADLTLPDSTGLDTPKRISDAAPDLPVIVMSGMSDETLALTAVEQGAQDYLVKIQVNRQMLVRAIHYAIERKRSERNLQQRNYELALLNHASQAINSSLDLDEILARVLEELYKRLQVVGTFWLIDPATEELVCRQASGPYARVVQNWRLKPGQGIVGWVVQHGERLVIPDSTTDPRHFQGVDEQTGQVYRSMLCVPLISKEQVIGALQVLDEEAKRFTSTDVSLIEALAATAAIAIENARLYESLQQELAQRKRIEAELLALSLSDELTGLYNRRGFFVLARQEIKLARRLRKEVTVIYADVDGFKRINDTWGHPEGDQALIQIAQILRQTFRDSDIVARLGGDEFAVFAADSDGEDLYTLSDRLKKKIDEANSFKQRPYLLSMSVGETCFQPESLSTLEEMLALADQAMYAEKQRNLNGRSAI